MGIRLLDLGRVVAAGEREDELGQLAQVVAEPALDASGTQLPIVAGEQGRGARTQLVRR